MAIDARRETQDLVGDGADFDANVALLHLLEHIRMARQRKAVADALRVQQEGVHKVAVGVGSDVEGLAAVEKKGNFDPLLAARLLELEKLGHKVFEWSAFAFFANEVKAYGFGQ